MPPDQLPAWLSANVQTDLTPVTQDAKKLLITQYTQLFEVVLEGICRGDPLTRIVEEDGRTINYESFLNWVHKDPDRKQRYEDAQQSRAELMSYELLQIADGVGAIDPNSNETVARDTLRIKTRQFLMAAHNRKRYGERAQLEITTTVSITSALEKARARAIDVNTKTLSDVELLSQ